MNSNGDEFSSERLIEVVAKSRHLSAAEIVHAIIQSVDDHRAGFAPNDDTTVVAVKLT